MSAHMFPTLRNIAPWLRRVFLFPESVASILLILLLGSHVLLCAQTPATQPQRRMPNFQDCEDPGRVRAWIRSQRLAEATPILGVNNCPAGTVYNHNPGPRQPISSPVTLYISLGRQIPPTPVPPTPVPPTPVPPTPVPPTPTPTSTPTPTPTVSPTATPTPTPTPTPPPTLTPSPTESPLPVPSPTATGNIIDRNHGGDWPWGWLLLAALIPVSAVGGGQVLRYQIWKKRISVEAAAGEPDIEWIGPLNPSFDPVSTRVQVLPGSVRFAGPIEVTKREVKNDQ